MTPQAIIIPDSAATANTYAKRDSAGAALFSNIPIKVSAAVAGNIVTLQSDGSYADSGYRTSDFAGASATTTALAAKAAKVAGATTHNFAGLTVSGDLEDSGHKHSDYALASHTHAEADVSGLVADLAARELTANKGAASGYASLDGTGKVPTSQLPSSVLGDMQYQGTWNANTNTPTIPAAASGNKGQYYVVSVAGSTSVSGITDWKIGDWLVSNGSSWDKIDNTDQVTSVNGFSGAVVLTTTDLAEGTHLYYTTLRAQTDALAAAVSTADEETTALLKSNGGNLILYSLTVGIGANGNFTFNGGVFDVNAAVLGNSFSASGDIETTGGTVKTFGLVNSSAASGTSARAYVFNTTNSFAANGKRVAQFQSNSTDVVGWAHNGSNWCLVVNSNLDVYPNNTLTDASGTITLHGATVTVTQNLSVSGTITGSGSGLTSVPASSLTGATLSSTVIHIKADTFFDCGTWAGFEEDFLGGTTGMVGLTTGGAGGVTSGNGTASHPGVVAISTGTGTTGAGVVRTANTADFLFGGGRMVYQSIFRIPTLSDGTNTFTVRFGFGNIATGEQNDGVFLRYTHGTNSGNWQLVAINNSSETATNSSSTPAANTWYRVKVEVNAAGTLATFYVNDVSIGTVASNIPTAAGHEVGILAGQIVKSAGTTARTIELDYVSFFAEITR